MSRGPLHVDNQNHIADNSDCIESIFNTTEMKENIEVFKYEMALPAMSVLGTST